MAMFQRYALSAYALTRALLTCGRRQELREILRCFHRAGIGTERLRILYSHVEQDPARLASPME